MEHTITITDLLDSSSEPKTFTGPDLEALVTQAWKWVDPEDELEVVSYQELWELCQENELEVQYSGPLADQYGEMDWE